jgi:CRISPR/Cas system-associated exonuclease Cas4 (RecB family)
MDDTQPLTKTLYLTGLDCPRKMWYKAHAPAEPGVDIQWQMEQGKKVGKRARGEFPESNCIRGPTTEAALGKTKEALKRRAGPLFEPAFLHEDLLVRVDILRPSENGGWILTEVKSTTSPDKENEQDVAFQKHVLEGTGLSLARTEVMHLNSDYRHPGVGDLFEHTDLTGELGSRLEEVREKAPELAETLKQDEPPEKSLIRECKGCDYQDRCWDLPEHSVFTLPNLHWRNTDKLLSEGRTDLDEVEDHETLKERHTRYIRAVRDERPYVEEAEIRDILDTLEYPLHFLDFEAIGRAIPQVEGTNPWQPVPFQYSLHVLERDGTLTHFEHLHDGKGDPRPELAEKLLGEVGDTGSVVAYHTSFEKRCLKALQATPSLSEELLQNLIDRLWDQRDIFSGWHYISPKQKGSTSIKNVLPALAPNFAHDDLSVQHGMEAVQAYEEMIGAKTQRHKKRLRLQLLSYCKRDTQAMVEIHRALRELVREP